MCGIGVDKKCVWWKVVVGLVVLRVKDSMVVSDEPYLVWVLSVLEMKVLCCVLVS